VAEDPSPTLSSAPAARGGFLTDAAPDTGEAFHLLAELGPVRIEHIVSSAAPDSGQQVQDWHEWVLLLAGAAELEVAGERLPLSTRDWVVIPAGAPHRVLSTQAGTEWLAVHASAVVGEPPAAHG
jgi:cupin 2 domain-containing protein